MRTRQLEMFIRVCELGSISRAAEQLNIAQPALGMNIRQLERAFGAQLITRHSRGVTLTLAGAVVLHAARDVLHRLQLARDAVQAKAAHPARTVTVGLSPSLAATLGSRLITGSAAMEGVVVQIVEELSHVLVEWALAGRLDLALAYSAPTPRLRLTPLLREQLFLVTARDAGPTAPVSLARALAGPLALPGRHDSVRRTVEAAAAAGGLPVPVRYEMPSITAIKQLVAGGLAQSILPWGVAQREVTAGDLTATPVASPALSRTLFLVEVPGRDEPAVAGFLVQLARSLADAGGEQGRFTILDSAVS